MLVYEYIRHCSVTSIIWYGRCPFSLSLHSPVINRTAARRRAICYIAGFPYVVVPTCVFCCRIFIGRYVVRSAIKVMFATVFLQGVVMYVELGMKKSRFSTNISLYLGNDRR